MTNRKKDESYQDFIARLYPNIDNIGEDNYSSARNITFCVTNACQLRCTYCYEKHKGNEFMSFETAKKFIDLILSGDKGMDQYINLKNSSAIILDFIGGEPLLATDLIDQIIDYWMDTTTELMHPWAEKFKVSICSNGVNYFEPKIQQFLEKHKNHLSFNITIDGCKELHDACRHYAGTTIGCYDEAIAAVKDWVSKGYYMDSKMTYAPENLDYMYIAMVKMLDDGYKNIHSNPAFEPEWSLEDGKKYYSELKKIADEILKRNLDMDNDYSIILFNENMFDPLLVEENKNWCGGTGAMIACDWDGKIYPCLRYMEMSLGDEQPPMVIGDVDNGMMQCQKYKDCVNCLKQITRKSQSTDECFYCPIASGCAWCSAWNYQLYGTADKRCTNICILHKARALANIYFWNKYYKQNKMNKKMEIYIPDEWALEIIDKKELNMLKNL